MFVLQKWLFNLIKLYLALVRKMATWTNIERHSQACMNQNFPCMTTKKYRRYHFHGFESLLISSIFGTYLNLKAFFTSSNTKRRLISFFIKDIINIYKLAKKNRKIKYQGVKSWRTLKLKFNSLSASATSCANQLTAF